MDKAIVLSLLFTLFAGCSLVSEVGVVTEAPKNCVSKGLVTINVFHNDLASERIERLKKEALGIGGNMLYCCWSRYLSIPDYEESAVAHNPKTGKVEPVLLEIGEAFYCAG